MALSSQVERALLAGSTLFMLGMSIVIPSASNPNLLSPNQTIYYMAVERRFSLCTQYARLSVLKQGQQPDNW
jgi:hypothetical protein